MGQNDPIDDIEGREITAQSVNERLDDWLIPVLIDQNPCAQSRSPMDMMRHG
jgi:hypothetical protein